MINFLRKLFIKDYLNIDSPKVRRHHGYLASGVGIFTNLLLFVFKIIVGAISGSVSMISDALNNLSDMASSIINLIGFKLAGKPADKEHPYGHERIEYIAGLIISFVIIVIAVVLGYTSIMKIIKNEATNYNYWTFIVLGVAIFLKLWQGYFYRKMSKIINSVSLKASAQDSINDVITTTVVLIAAIIEYCSGGTIHIDGWCGLALSIFIVVMGIKMSIESSNPLIGINPSSDLVKNIIKDILAYDGVLGVHDTMCHCYGPSTIFMTIHVEVDAKVNVMISHDLIDNIEKEISLKHHVVLTIHLDPVVTDSPFINKLKKQVEEIIANTNKEITFHDFRVVEGVTHTNILFDVVIPYHLKNNTREIVTNIQSQIKALDDKYIAIIMIDNDYL